MTREENQEVEFYKSDLVQQMLQDDLLCDDDKRIVRAAVLTSRKNPPNMTLIREADMLLKELAQTRKETPQESVALQMTSKAVVEAYRPTGLSNKTEQSPTDRKGSWNQPILSEKSHALLLVPFILFYVLLSILDKFHILETFELGKYSLF